MSPDAAEAVIGAPGIAGIEQICDLSSTVPLTKFDSDRSRRLLADVEVLITGWGSPILDAAVLDSAPGLELIVHTAGSIRGHVTQECFDRGITVVSAAAANARPVVEYTLAMILLEGKHVLRRAAQYRRDRSIPTLAQTDSSLGNFGRTVGILSASLIGRGVMELLRHHDCSVLLYDPYVEPNTAADYGAELVGIEELFRRSDIISVHTPLLPATRGMVSRRLIESMPPGAVLINTSRGAIVDQSALTDSVLDDRLRAVLDVTDPEALPPEHPLWDCENVLLTPHLAGSQGNELGRLRALALEELRRWVLGDDLMHSLPPNALEITA
ncbi:hydroxyacid dehydrogenase [Nesterenkonia halotolerans]|uniref:Phosphoglycerate dehydrogenase-like enzyme n=1 Tax=Nesterenkonia halotolerans TaxID=225325 RepID=A0ABR9JA32_9MICC|nr:hydroxyacid dehydrogenase [Nesterenkonia halotolerans]MBE1515714.1 phosphoglycerate dehydrogenase-like enzyme [Nesterenkonia halotolerans]